MAASSEQAPRSRTVLAALLLAACGSPGPVAAPTTHRGAAAPSTAADTAAVVDESDPPDVVGAEDKAALASPPKKKRAQPAEDDTPLLIGGSLADETNSLSVRCERLDRPAANGRARAVCTTQQVIVHAEDAADVERQIAEREAAVKAKPPALAGVCKGLLAEPSRGDDEAKRRAAVAAACGNKDLSGVMAALAAYEREVTARTCRVEHGASFTYVFEQVDANTWVHNQTPEPPCNTSLILTISRQNSDSEPWSFKQVRDVPSTAPETCRIAKSSTMEFSPLNRFARPTKCKFIEM